MGAGLERLIELPQEERIKVIRSIPAEQIEQLLYSWEFWARPNQLAPSGDWNTWLLLAGRGFGKSRCGIEYVRREVEAGRARRIAILAPTAADCRDVIVEGESGFLAISPPSFRPVYEPSKRRLTWPNGAIATLYSADVPERLRGPQFDLCYADEIAAWRYFDAWDQVQFGLRLGERPRSIVTTTPKPVKIIKDLLADPAVAVTRGTTYDNLANLAPSFIRQVMGKYEGTRLGRQELRGELLEDVEGALWTRRNIDDNRVLKAPELTRIVVAVDPSATGGGNEAGIIVGGLGRDGHGYILDDQSLQGSPDSWGRAAVTAYHKWRADRLVAETNQGGEMVKFVVATVDKNVAFKGVHASRGKLTRAEPIAALYEQGRVHHVGSFGALEDEMCSWVPGEESPNRMDALVWCLTELMLGNSQKDVPPPIADLTRANPWI